MNAWQASVPMQKGEEMTKAILAKKIGMTQIFDENGVVTPVTVLEAGPCVVTQIKTEENDGYNAVQVGFGESKDKVVEGDKIAHAHGTTKPMQGHFKKAGVESKKYVKEFRFDNAAEYQLAQEIRLISLQQVISSMQLQSQRVKVSRALSRDLVSTEDL